MASLLANSSSTFANPNGTGTNPDTSGISSGLSGVDALITSFNSLISGQAKTAAKQAQLLKQKTKQQNRANRKQLRLLQAEIDANAKPSDFIPPAPTLSNAEAVQAADQVRIDAAKRTGQRASLLAGNQMGGMGGAMSPATGLRSLLG